MRSALRRWDQGDLLPPDALVPAAQDLVRRRWDRLHYVGRRRRRLRQRQADAATLCAWFLALVTILTGVLTTTEDVSRVVDARRLAEVGHSAEVIGAQLHVTDRRASDGLPEWIVDGMHVTFAGGPGVGVVLDGIRPFRLAGGGGATGWVPATTQTGYVDDFRIRYAVDDEGRTVAMTEADVAYWTAADRVWWEAMVALAVVMGASLVHAWRTLAPRRLPPITLPRGQLRPL